MASAGNRLFNAVSIGVNKIVSIISRGIDIIWGRTIDTLPGLSHDVLNFDTNGSPQNQTVDVTFPNIFTFTDVATNVVSPTGVTVTSSPLMTQGVLEVVRLTVNAVPNPTTQDLNQTIVINLGNRHMSLNVTVRREGQSALTAVTASPTSVPAQQADADRTVTFTVTGDTGTPYMISSSFPGITFANNTGRTVGDGTNVTTIIPRNTSTTLARTISFTARNGNATGDIHTTSVSQAANTPLQVSLSADELFPVTGERVTLTATINSGTANYRYRFFRLTPGTTSVPVTATLFAASTPPSGYNELGSVTNPATSATTATRNHVILTNEEAAYIVWVEDGTSPTNLYEEANLTLQSYSAYGLVARHQDVQWYELSGQASLRLAGIPGSSVISVSATGANIGAQPTITTSGLVRTITYTWDEGNPNHQATRNQTITVTYEPANGTNQVIATFIAQQGAQLSRISPLGLNEIRNFDDSASREVGVSISNFPSPNHLIAQSLPNINNGQPTVANIASNGNLTLTSAGIIDQPIVGSTAYVRRTTRRNGSTATAMTVTPGTTTTTIVLTGADSDVTDNLSIGETVDLWWIYNIPSAARTVSSVTSGNETTVDGANLIIGGPGNARYDATTPAGWKSDFAVTAINTSVTTAAVTTPGITFRGVLISSPVYPGNNLLRITKSARPKIAEQILNNTTIEQATPPPTIDTDLIFSRVIDPTENEMFDIWLVHDITDRYLSTTDSTGDDFIDLTAQTTSRTEVLPSGFPSTVNTVAGSSVATISSVYVALTRIRYQVATGRASNAVIETSDVICINTQPV